jgi:hypothetical protein
MAAALKALKAMVENLRGTTASIRGSSGMVTVRPVVVPRRCDACLSARRDLRELPGRGVSFLHLPVRASRRLLRL